MGEKHDITIENLTKVRLALQIVRDLLPGDSRGIPEDEWKEVIGRLSDWRDALQTKSRQKSEVRHE